MPRIINGTLDVSSYTPTGTPGEYTFTNALYNNVADATGNGTADLSVGFILYVPAADPISFFGVPGVVHRYVLTSITVIDFQTIDGTMLYDETGAEYDAPLNGSTAIISEKGTGLGLGFPVSSQVYATLGAGFDMSAMTCDLRNIIDKITTGGTADKEITETQNALLTTADGDFGISTGLSFDPEGWVVVTVNGVEVIVGDGVTTNCYCYFTDPSNGTPKTADNITTGDKIRWVGTYATYELATSDIVQMTYEYVP